MSPTPEQAIDSAINALYANLDNITGTQFNRLLGVVNKWPGEK